MRPLLLTSSPLFGVLAVLVIAGCAAPRPAAERAETRRDLTRALIARGWVVEPTDNADPFGVASRGTAYLVRRRGADARRLVTFEAPPTDDGAPDRDALDADYVFLRQRLAGRSAVFYRRPALLVVTFGAGRTELDLRLIQLLGLPVTAVEE